LLQSTNPSCTVATRAFVSHPPSPRSLVRALALAHAHASVPQPAALDLVDPATSEIIVAHRRRARRVASIEAHL
jgi:hypothetical protein